MWPFLKRIADEIELYGWLLKRIAYENILTGYFQRKPHVKFFPLLFENDSILKINRKYILSPTKLTQSSL